MGRGRVRRVLPERIVGLASRPSDRRSPDGRDEPSAPTHDRGHDGPQSVAGDAAILRQRRRQVYAAFRPFPDPAQLAGWPRHLVWIGTRLPALHLAVCAFRFFYGVTL